MLQPEVEVSAAFSVESGVGGRALCVHETENVCGHLACRRDSRVYGRPCIYRRGICRGLYLYRGPCHGRRRILAWLTFGQCAWSARETGMNGEIALPSC